MKKNNGGFSLVEILVAISILGIFFGTACSALVLGHRLNTKTDTKLQTQQAVSSAVETLMAEGLDSEQISADNGYYLNDQVKVTVNPLSKESTISTTISKEVGGILMEIPIEVPIEIPLQCYEVVVESIEGDFSVTTYIKEKVTVTES